MNSIRIVTITKENHFSGFICIPKCAGKKEESSENYIIVRTEL